MAAWIVLVTALLMNGAAIARESRAVVIGIDTYEPEKPASAPPGKRARWTDLDGAVADATAFKELLVSKYGFKAGDVHLVTNRDATRERILTEIRTWLVEPAAAGDVAVLFYAGHGSQVTNSLSAEADKRDESLVPADSCLGADDLRDKELSPLFNRILDKQAMFTAIFDSCHSGSIARGYPSPGKSRQIPVDPKDCADATAAGERPEERGALILSAAQHDQLAGEQCDDDGASHGRFTLALLSTLRATPPGEPAERVFRSLRARMQSTGSPQEPVLAGRAKRSLFGHDTRSSSGKTTVAVLDVAETGAVNLQAGRAVGLLPGCELIPADPNAPALRLRVENVSSLTRSQASLVAGDKANVTPGQLLVVDRWIAPESRLRVHVGPAYADRAALAKLLGELDAKVRRLEDPTIEAPTHVLRWTGTEWQLGGAALGATGIVETVAAKLPPDARLFVDVPPPEGLKEALERAAGTRSLLSLEAAPATATYLLVGRGAGAFAWVLPGALESDARKVALPVRTDWIVEAPDLASRLHEFAQRIARLKAWLELEPPPDDGNFPYRLALRDKKTKEVIARETLVKGEAFDVELVCHDEDLARSVDRRYVYVFAIDSFGKGTLLFPRATAGSVENRLPLDDPKGNLPTVIPLGRTIRVQPPYGLDALVMLTTEEALPEPDIFEFQGVRTRGERAAPTPLARVLHAVAGGQRGLGVEAPATWSIQHVLMRSVPAAGAH